MCMSGKCLAWGSNAPLVAQRKVLLKVAENPIPAHVWWQLNQPQMSLQKLKVNGRVLSDGNKNEGGQRPGSGGTWQSVKSQIAES